MKLSRNALVLALASFVHQATAQDTNLIGCIPEGTFDPNVDYFPDKVEVEYSKFWTVAYENSYKIVTVYDTLSMEGSMPMANQTSVYVFYQCGAPQPLLTDANSDNVQYFSVPLQHAAVTQTTEIPHFELLGLRLNVTAYAGDTQYVSSPCVNVLLDSGEIETFTNTSTFQTTYPDGASLVSPWASDKKDAGRLIIAEGSEKSNMAIFEWHKMYGLMYNNEKTANSLYEEAKARYECVSNNAVQSVNEENKPKLLWAYWSTWANAWDVGECPNYYCEFAELCGAELMGSSEGSVEQWGSVYMTDAEFETHAKDADFWIFPSADAVDVLATKSSILSSFKSVQNQQVFDYQGSGGNSWFEQRLAEPDVVIEDFCAVLGVSTGGDTPHQREWFRNVYTEGIGDAGVCTDVGAPLQSQADQCTPLSSPVVTGSPVAAPIMTASPVATPVATDTPFATDSPVASGSGSPVASLAFAVTVGSLILVNTIC